MQKDVFEPTFMLNRNTRKIAIIHVGLHKTGTTSIQLAFNGYNDGETIYADLGDPNHSILFKTIFEDNILLSSSSGIASSDVDAISTATKYWSLLRREINRSCSRVIFSGEDISILSEIALRRLKSFLEYHFCGIMVVVFLRDPLAWTASAIQQTVKEGGSVEDNSPYPSNFSLKLKRLFAVFGEQNIKICYFEDGYAYADGGGVVDVFSDALGLNTPRKNISVWYNKSLSVDAIMLLNKFNSFGILQNKHPVFNFLRDKFAATLEEIFSNHAETKGGGLDYYHRKVDWKDVEELNQLINRPYKIFSQRPNLEGDFSDYFRSYNCARVRSRLSDYLKDQNVAVPVGLTADELATLVFYHVIQNCAREPLINELKSSTDDLHQRDRDLSMCENNLSIIHREFSGRLHQLQCEIDFKDKELKLERENNVHLTDRVLQITSQSDTLFHKLDKIKGSPTWKLLKPFRLFGKRWLYTNPH